MFFFVRLISRNLHRFEPGLFLQEEVECITNLEDRVSVLQKTDCWDYARPSSSWMKGLDHVSSNKKCTFGMLIGADEQSVNGYLLGEKKRFQSVAFFWQNSSTASSPRLCNSAR